MAGLCFLGDLGLNIPNVMRITDPAQKSSEHIADADGTIVFLGKARVMGLEGQAPGSAL